MHARALVKWYAAKYTSARHKCVLDHMSPDHTLFGLGYINGPQYNVATFEREQVSVAVAIVAPGDQIYRRIVNKRVDKLLQRPRW